MIYLLLNILTSMSSKEIDRNRTENTLYFLIIILLIGLVSIIILEPIENEGGRLIYDTDWFTFEAQSVFSDIITLVLGFVTLNLAIEARKERITRSKQDRELLLNENKKRIQLERLKEQRDFYTPLLKIIKIAGTHSPKTLIEGNIIPDKKLEDIYEKYSLEDTKWALREIYEKQYTGSEKTWEKLTEQLIQAIIKDYETIVTKYEGIFE